MNAPVLLLRLMTRFCCLALVTVFAATRMSAADDGQSFTNSADNFRVSLPGGWKRIAPQNPMIKFAAQNASNTRRIAIMVMPQTVPRITPEFITGMKKGMERSGSIVESDRTIEVQGLPAVELIGKTAPASGSTPMIVRCILSDKQSYQVIGVSQNIPDAEIAQVFESFQLLNVPNMKRIQARSAGYELGRRVGALAAAFLIPTVVLLAIVAIILVFVLRKKKQPPPLP
jgi:hypothetical protein